MGGTRRRGRGWGASQWTIESTVERLVEAEHMRLAARAELERFTEANGPPDVPEEFTNLSELVEYHKRFQEYQAAINRRKEDVGTAEKSYNEAADSLRDVLPEDVPLRYDYPGRKEPMVGKRYAIVKKNNEVIIPEIEER